MRHRSTDLGRERTTPAYFAYSQKLVGDEGKGAVWADDEQKALYTDIKDGHWAEEIKKEK